MFSKTLIQFALAGIAAAAGVSTPNCSAAQRLQSAEQVIVAYASNPRWHLLGPQASLNLKLETKTLGVRVWGQYLPGFIEGSVATINLVADHLYRPIMAEPGCFRNDLPAKQPLGS